MQRGWGRSAIAGLIIIACTAGAQAQAPAGAAMPTGGWANPPVGHIAFCRSHPAECRSAGAAQPMRLDDGRWQQLVAVNAEINRSIVPVTDLDYHGIEELWTLPVSHGDCEDYVLLKRHRLVRLGWPAGALLATVVFDEEGEGHAVLAVRTDRGDLILDNKTDAVRFWHDTAYRYVKRQSDTDPKRWVSISDTRWAIGAASAAR
ncbi:MAG TPA: transglutaminase-like cysteine peptidase [Afifellaceae bacterium]|nr:transglutaminase-like cysteine peptidase [Afifellaceae bacterium]